MKIVKMRHLITSGVIESRIFVLRGKKVMLDKDLAGLYGVSTKRLNEQVKRNPGRFPEDFMLQLTWEESRFLRSQNASLKRGKHAKYRGYAFTEPGVAMLSSVLNSETAVQVNIQIIRTFIKLREILLTHKDLRRKIEDMENKYDCQFKVVFDAIKKLLAPPAKPRRKIGFCRG